MAVDMANHETTWKNLQQLQGADLHSLAHQVPGLRECPQPPAGLLRQTVVNCPNLKRQTRSTGVIAAAAENDFKVRIAVKSLGQLYAQASVVNIWLREKARAWALVSRGMVYLRSSATDAAAGGDGGSSFNGDSRLGFVWEQAEDLVAWADLKAVERAAEKVLLCYEQVVWIDNGIRR